MPSALLYGSPKRISSFEKPSHNEAPLDKVGRAGLRRCVCFAFLFYRARSARSAWGHGNAVRVSQNYGSLCVSLPKTNPVVSEYLRGFCGQKANQLYL